MNPDCSEWIMMYAKHDDFNISWSLRSTEYQQTGTSERCGDCNIHQTQILFVRQVSYIDFHCFPVAHLVT